jgi:gliding motility-associated-like protein
MKLSLRFLFIYLLIFTGVGFEGHAQAYFPIDFVENKGQWEGDFRFRSESGNGAMFIETNGFTILQHHPEDFKKVSERFHGHGATEAHEKEADGRPYRSIADNGPINVRSHALKVRFAGSSQPQIQPEAPREGYDNYFLGNDSTRWTSHVKTYTALRFRNMYPGVDVKYYSDGGLLKYDLLVAPGADLNRIRIRYDGATRIQVKNGELIVTTSVGEVKELRPYAYQIVGGQKKEVSCSFVVKGADVSFRLSGYNPSAELVIDPTLIFSTYTGSRSGNWGFTATPGDDGSLFAGGIVFNGGGYPVSTGAFQTTFQGGGQSLGVDMAITRFSTDGTQRLYSTYLGGSQDEYPHSMYADPAGNLVILGRTTSSNFPTTFRFGNNQGKTDIVVVKLNATGTALIGSLKIGGSEDDGANMDASGQPNCASLLYNYGDNARSEVVLDAANNIYVAASTFSSNFPTLNAVQNSLGGKQDAVLIKISPNLNNILFSTYLGGSEDDAGFVLALDPITSDVYMAGATASQNFPKASNLYNGAIDGYVAVISNNGLIHRSSRYFGTSSLDIIYGIQFDAVGFPYIMGISLGSWTVENAAYSNPGSKQFISKLRRDLNGYVYSTVFGAAAAQPNISPVAFLVDKCENVYISGWGGKLNPCNTSSCFDAKTSGTSGMPVTQDAIKSTTDGRDFYFFVMEKDATRQLYGSFWGQTGGEGDHVDGGTSRFDRRGAIYMAICANCLGNNACAQSPITQQMPVTPGVVAPRNGALGTGSGGDCNLAAVKILFDYQGVLASVQSSINGVQRDSSGCVPLTVDFTDTIGAAQSFIWNFGDGSPDVTTTDPSVSHTFVNPGTYRVRLIAVDNSKCIPRDTAFKFISVRTDKANLNFTELKLPPCESLNYRFDNLSIPPSGKPFAPGSFIWDFGDNTPRVTGGSGSVNHRYASPGTYNVRLVLNDTNYCNHPDSLTRTVRVAPNVNARFQTASTGCAPFRAVFNNTSLAGEIFEWDFGDGSTFVGPTPPPKVYSTPGVYTVRLIAIDPNTCNQRDTTTIQITVHPNPVANFTFRPNPPQENTPTQFTNRSTGAVRYRWDFGDGDTSILADPLHQYRRSGNFQACLEATNQFGCTDTVCLPIEAIVLSIVDVPNAFSPNGDGINDQVFVRGFGVEQLNFRIFNRQGLLVFQSTSQAIGWDGKFKGILQPMDVYAYVLDIRFTDGNSIQKKGDITLLR